MIVVVERILSRRTFGTIFAGRDAQGALVRVKLNNGSAIGIPDVGETWSIDGSIEQSPWGPQIKGIRAVRTLPSGRLMVEYLSASVAGIGPTRAGRLWAHFGEQLPEALDLGDVDAIAIVMDPDRPALAPRLAAVLVSEWKRIAGEGRLIEWLAAAGIYDIRLAKRLFVLLGDQAPAKLGANPWCLVPFLPWRRVDRLALKLSIEAGHLSPERLERRFMGAADSVIKDVIAVGATAVSAPDFRAMLARKLKLDALDLDHAIELALGRRAVVADADGTLRAPGCAMMEEAVSRRLKEMLRLAPASFASATILEGLSDEQASAVRKILATGFACIRGRAGVGKTHVTKAICDVWDAAGGNLILAAVAGKAALRLSHATGRLARTLHRTIGELDERARILQEMDDSPGSDRRSRLESRLRELVVANERTLAIVDEASMLDLANLYKLLDRLPAGAKMVLIGDECQLPPVSFGLTFHRLARDASVTATLSRIHRQAKQSEIPKVASAIRRRETPELATYDGEHQGVFLVHAQLREAIAENVTKVFGQLSRQTDTMIVTPVNETVVGVAGLNRRLHDAYVERTSLQELRGPLGDLFSAGEPVVHRRNDYHRGLWNGSTGTVFRIDRDRRSLTAIFDDREHVFASDDLVDISLGYALTCHRSQGSEATNVIVALPPSRLLDPSWLYTALTRAKTLAVIVGQHETIENALRRPYADESRLVGLRWPN
uniref:UvrD-like helicase C-terminal domain-containing protein n=1 Tax=Rhodopseudomonas palustris (strain BisA53) TaxID=316055 RepID=Q07NS0_RHOP5